ncbi:MAG: c-type cytochrome [Tagaea sp.]
MKSTLAAALALAVILGPSAARAGDAAAGAQVFRRICSTCHIATAEGRRGVGPTLFGVVGRKAGTLEGFRYSEANKNSGIVWTPDVLDKYIENPRAVVPGTIMTYAGLRTEADRANVIAYLETLK